MRIVRTQLPDDRVVVGAELADGSVVLAGSTTAAADDTDVADVVADTSARERLLERLDAVNGRRDEFQAQGLVVPVDDVRLVVPVDRAATLVNVGSNYREHETELGDDSGDISWFIKDRHAAIGTGHGIRIPPHLGEMVDYEGELAVVFGRRTYCVDAEEVADHIAGYTVANDVSARDAWPRITAARTAREGREAWAEMLLGKQLPTFAPLGPAIVTADDIADVGGLRLTTRLNGEVVQDATVDLMKVPIAELVARLSRYFEFQPGDVLSTGSPAGVGMGRTPQRFLRPGDEVSVTVDGIGTLTNPVLEADHG